MLTLLVLALAVSGGLCVGTIAFSAYQFAALDKAFSHVHRSGIITLA